MLNFTEMAFALDIQPITLEALVHSGSIPYTYINNQVAFNPYTITEWLQSKPKIDFTNSRTDNLRKQYHSMFPDIISQLKVVDQSFSPKQQPKLYSLSKVKNKKHIFLYYVRYSRNGEYINSRWTTHTNNKNAANLFAKENRERILNEYDAKHDKTKVELHNVLKSYYAKDSAYMIEAAARDRVITDTVRHDLHNFILNHIIPFLTTNRIFIFEKLTPAVIIKLQAHLRKDRQIFVKKYNTFIPKPGINPQTINKHLCSIRAIFRHLIIDGVITDNPFDKVPLLKIKGHCKTHGCIELETVYGVFNDEWSDEFSYLLNLIIYSTDLRNCEITRMKVEDIIEIGGCHFINIPDPSRTKTENGVRIVPLHPFVYEKVSKFLQNKNPEDYAFSKKGTIYSSVYEKAYKTLAEKLGLTEEYLKRENITFYSGRHYWKTLMSAEGLGEVGEYFMGHKVSSDVAKLYNHRNKVGQEMIIKKAKEVFDVLDRTLLKKKP